MNHFRTLYRYEVKKILCRKLVWIVFLVCVLCVMLFTLADLTGKYYVDGKVVDTHYHMFKVDQGYHRALSGRALDQQLLGEMAAAYGKIPAGEERYMLTEEYQTYARPYSEIFNIVRLWTQQWELGDIQTWIPDESALYAARMENLGKEWQVLRLSDAEKNFWREKEARTEIPLFYYYHDGYSKIISNGLNTVGLLTLLLVCICMTGVFTEEHVRRTDQLILSSAKGRGVIYWAKLSAGVSVSGLFALLLSALTFCAAFAIYGADGFGTSLRFCAYLWTSSCNISIGQVCLTAYGVLVLTAVVVSVLVQVLSEVLRSNIATLSCCVGVVIAGMVVKIPYQYRVPSQFWDWSPVRYLNAEYVFDSRMLSVFGHCLESWQIVPVLYILVAAAVAFAGKYVYRNYQVSGR